MTTWHDVIGGEKEKEYFHAVRSFEQNERNHHKVFPAAENVFKALELTPFDNVKVVILGQDPYHGDNQAHGLSFSVQKGIDLPPSLLNIYKELESDLGIPVAKSGDLTAWAKQGVLLLNTVFVHMRRIATEVKDGRLLPMLLFLLSIKVTIQSPLCYGENQLNQKKS